MEMASTSANSTATMTSSTNMSMPTSTSSMSTKMSMPKMAMVFFSSVDTPLFSSSWAPSNAAQYVGTCIFLLVLTMILRALFALKSVLERTAWKDNVNDASHYHPARGHLVPCDDKSSLADRYLAWMGRSAWSPRIDSWRAGLDTLIVGVGYLLMLAVMTMNVGYFVSVLAGTYLGSFLVGRFNTSGVSAC